MMRRILLGLVAVMLLPVCALAATVTITISNNFFTPSDVNIALGDTVHWTKPGAGFHLWFDAETCLIVNLKFFIITDNY